MEELFEEARYTVRFEKGNFNSGYCVLEEKKVVVVNKFFNLEGRINAMVEIIQSLPIKEEELSGEMLRWYKQLKEQPEFGGNENSVQTQMEL
jgi:hypothetical protein